MQKIWLEHYPNGVPHEIDPNQYNSLSELFEKKVAEYGDEIAYSNLGIHMTYRELEEHSRHFANFLLQTLLLKKGDRVGIMLPNILQFPVALFGILRAGLIAVNINPLYTPAELEPILKSSGLETILVLAQFAHVIQKVTTFSPLKNIIVTEIADLFPPIRRFIATVFFKYLKRSILHYRLPSAISFREALIKGKNVLFRPIPMDSHDIALLQYTGGTTGLPKGVMLTHHNLLANIEQAVAWVSPLLKPRKEIFITALPLYHIFSLTGNAFVSLYLGAQNILITNPKDTKRLISEIAHTHFTVITGVNTLYKAMVQRPEFARDVDFKSLKIALAGGMSLHPSVAKKWKEITAKPLIVAYGLSETSPGISMMPVICKEEYEGTVGIPWPSTQLDIREPDSQRSLEINEVGEIWVKGPQVMKGYWQNPEATQQVLAQNGWLNTGDIGKIDEHGFLYIVDRTKDMIIISGFNVYPSEIENVIIRHPDVLEVAVVGIRDTEGQEIVKACIVRRDVRLTRAHVINYCKIYLTPYKIPKIIEFYDALPKSQVGKVLKRELRK